MRDFNDFRPDFRPALPDFATLPNLNAVKFLARRNNFVIPVPIKRYYINDSD